MANPKTRPDAPLVHNDPTEHRRAIALRANIGLPYDGSRGMNNPLQLAEFTVSGAPDASLWEGGAIYVSDETGGKTIAFSDGTNWRRVQDRAIIS